MTVQAGRQYVLTIYLVAATQLSSWGQSCHPVPTRLSRTALASGLGCPPQPTPTFHTTPSPGPGNLPSSRLEEALKSTLSILPPRPPFPPWALQLPLMLLHKDRKLIASQAALPALLRGATRSLYLPWIWSLLCP